MPTNSIQKLPNTLSQRFSLERILGGYELKPNGPISALYATAQQLWAISEAIQCWSPTTGEEEKYIPNPERERISELSPNCYISPEGVLLLMNSTGLYRYENETITLLHRLNLSALSTRLSFSRDGTRAIISEPETSLHFLDLVSQAEPIRIRLPHRKVWISPDGDGLLVSGEAAQQLTRYDWQLNELWSLSVPSKNICLSPLFDDFLLLSEGDVLRCIVLSTGEEVWRIFLPGSRLFFPVASNNCIAVNNTESIFLLDFHGNLISQIDGISVLKENQLAISPDGSWLAAVENDYQVKIFDLPSKRERFLGDGHASRINQISWLSDTKLLSVARKDLLARIWNTSTGETERLLDLLPDASNAGTTNDSQLLVFRRGAVEQFDMRSDGWVCRYELTPDRVTSFTTSTGGNYFFARGESSIAAWRLGVSTPLWSKKLSQRVLDEDYIKTIFVIENQEHTLWAYDSKALYNYDAQTGETKEVFRLPEEYTLLEGIYIPEKNLFIAFVNRANSFGEIQLVAWIPSQQRKLWTYSVERQAIPATARGRDWFFYRDKNRMVFCDLMSGHPVETLSLDDLEDEVTISRLSRDQTRIAIGTKRGALLLFTLPLSLLP